MSPLFLSLRFSPIVQCSKPKFEDHWILYLILLLISPSILCPKDIAFHMTTTNERKILVLLTSPTVPRIILIYLCQPNWSQVLVYCIIFHCSSCSENEVNPPNFHNSCQCISQNKLGIPPYFNRTSNIGLLLWFSLCSWNIKGLKGIQTGIKRMGQNSATISPNSKNVGEFLNYSSYF